ncbi:hypothetical protein WMY93_006925 [Mugilogobius chulae]|uniref:tRNA (adenine(37)-N6)-methyltransferase n=1 Tax=Mugilogobius chulae TaxID=88201 RepID=A0AAW0PLH7_9GOBI
MSHQCNICEKKLQELNQQVSVMRKEIKNLRQMLDSASRAHHKHIISLKSVMAKSDQKVPRDAQTPSYPLASQASALEQGVIQTVPIGYLSSCFSAKNGTPRQPTICGSSRAELRIQQSVFNNPEHALEGLEQYSHVWIIFVFHKNGHLSTKAKVKPPRLDGEKVGVYSTRSPHRPNALGLTLAKLDKVAGDTIYLSDIDMINGTPVLDIKPYIPDYDSIDSRVNAEKTEMQTKNDQKKLQNEDTKRQKLEQVNLVSGSINSDQLSNLQSVLEDVKAFVSQSDFSLEEKNIVSKSSKKSILERPSTWIREPPISSLEVRFTAHAEKELAEFLPAGCNERDGPKFKFLRSTEEAVAAIRSVLSADPRSVYRRGRCTDKLFYFTLDTADVTCWFGQGFAEVLQIRPFQQLSGVAKTEKNELT